MPFELLVQEFLTRGARIVLILLLSWAAYTLMQRLVPRLIRAALRRQHEQESNEEVLKREETLTHVVSWSAGAVFFFVAGLTILAEMDVNLAPALASLGIAGVALGFGAQSLVKDVLSGLFILLEDQYRKGDVVRVAGVGGLVEEVNLRRTVLRDLDGVVHSVPNGAIGIASNYTREWSRVNLDITVAYGTDVERAREVIDRLGAELAEDPEFGPMITEAPRLIRVDALQDSGITLKVLGVTKPMRQWDVAGEFRRRLLTVFTQAGIAFPVPYRVVPSRPETQLPTPPAEPQEPR